MERYSLDLSAIRLEHLAEFILGRRMIPSRSILQENTREQLHLLRDRGIGNLKQLLSALGNKEKIQKLSQISGIPENFLVLLKREAGSYLARPFPLSRFPGIPFEYAEVLKSKGIRHAGDFFEYLQDPDQKEALSVSTGIPDYRLDEIFILCDLSRINGIGPLFARILYETGVRSLEDLAASDATTLNPAFLDVIHKYGYPAHPLSEEDLAYCIFYAEVIMQQRGRR